MLIGINKKGEPKNIIVSDKGEVLVKNSENTTIGNSEENPIPVKEIKDIETTLFSNVETVGTAATTIAINKKVTEISIANYSETSNITIVAGEITAVIGSNITTNLKINKQVDNISLSAEEDNTKVQIIVSGVE